MPINFISLKTALRFHKNILDGEITIEESVKYLN